MSPNWDGKERRLKDEHMEVLMDIKVDMAEMRSDTKHVLEWGAKHDVKDDIRFKIIEDGNVVRDRIIWGALGVVSFIEIASKFIK